MIYKVMLMVLLIGALSVPAVGYAQEDEVDNTILFIGTVTDEPDIFVGLAVNNEEVVFYICDGNAEENTVSIAQWFFGTVANEDISITAANGNRVEISIDGETATGTLTLTDGSTKSFEMHLVTSDDAALYRSEFVIGGDAYVSGWLILEDGSVRGASDKLGTPQISPASFSATELKHFDPNCPPRSSFGFGVKGAGFCRLDNNGEQDVF
jgi:hypothetical protein